MAKTKQARAIVTPLELDKTIVVDEQVYNINAVRADTVGHTLSITTTDTDENGRQTIREIDFNGSADDTISVVSAEHGGRFNGPVLVPNNNDEQFNSEAVLNYNDIKNVVLKELANNSILYEYVNGALVSGGVENQIKSICVITGSNADVVRFAEENYRSKQFSAYIYIAEDGNIYFGVADLATPVMVKVSAETALTAVTADSAKRLAHANRFITDLASAEGAEFDGTNDATLGITGVLPLNRGGTGAVTPEEAKQNLGLASVATSGSYNDLLNKPKYAASSTEGGAATSAIQATKDGKGNIIDTYYQPKILTGTVDPNTTTNIAVKDAPNGAIYIRYST